MSDRPVPAELLDGYPELLAEVAGTGRRPNRAELDRLRTLGTAAAERGVPLRALLDAYAMAVELAWPTLPQVADAPTATRRRAAGTAVLAAARRAAGAVAEGYERAVRLAASREDEVRRQFTEDLLGGGADPGRLAERAERFGVLLAGQHVVTLARADEGFAAGGPVTRQVADSLLARFGAANALVTTRDGLLVCITPAALRGTAGELAHRLVTALGTDTGWQVAVGRAHSGPGGVHRSYEEARGALHHADRLGLRAPVLYASDLLVFPVLLRDREAITDLITTVLGPLAGARGGAGPLLDTLREFFACHGNITATARRLGISARAVTYRLDRVQRLTGYAPTEPTQRFTLEAAVLGARLLDWPDQPLPG